MKSALTLWANLEAARVFKCSMSAFRVGVKVNDFNDLGPSNDLRFIKCELVAV